MQDKSIKKSKPSWPLWVLSVGLLSAVMALASYFNAFQVSEEMLINSYIQEFNVSENYSGESLLVKAVPGSDVNLEIIMEKSIKGLWSTEQIDVNIENQEGEQSIIDLEIERSKDWSEDIDFRIMERWDSAELSVKFRFPEDSAVGSTLSGSIHGKITYPIKEIGNQQKDIQASLNQPLSVDVVSPEELSNTIRGTAIRYMIIFGVIAVIGIGIPIVNYLFCRKTVKK